MIMSLTVLEKMNWITTVLVDLREQYILVDGAVPYRGRVEYCKSGGWITVCNSYRYYWSTNDAAVVLHQLGYPSAGIFSTSCSLVQNIMHI